MTKKSDKQILFEKMGLVTGMPINEVFGWSAKEKEAKANKELIEKAKQEIQNYNFNRVYFQPASNADARDVKQGKEVRINGIKQELPFLAQLMPELFDLNQGIVSAAIKTGSGEHNGMIPSNWQFLKDYSGLINQEKAVQELNKRIDGLNQKTGMNEDDKWIQKAVDPDHKGYCTPMTKDTCTPRRKALAKRFKAGIEDESVLKESDEHVNRFIDKVRDFVEKYDRGTPEELDATALELATQYLKKNERTRNLNLDDVIPEKDPWFHDALFSQSSGIPMDDDDDDMLYEDKTTESKEDSKNLLMERMNKVAGMPVK